VDVIVYFNLHPNHFLGYEHGQPLKKVFGYEAPEPGEPDALADQAFQAFNAPPELVPAAYRDVAKNYRAADVRSLSVGDVLKVGEVWLACAATSWIKLEQAPRQVTTASRSVIDILVVTPAGEVKDCSLSSSEGEWPTARAVLETLYDQIGCTTVDVVALSPEIDMWVDDEGALKPQLRVNQLASYIATRFGLPFQLYVGTAVFTGGPDAKGATTSLGQPARKSLITLIDELRSIPWGR
jgi:hypothetical protein